MESMETPVGTLAQGFVVKERKIEEAISEVQNDGSVVSGPNVLSDDTGFDINRVVDYGVLEKRSVDGDQGVGILGVADGAVGDTELTGACSVLGISGSVREAEDVGVDKSIEKDGGARCKEMALAADGDEAVGVEEIDIDGENGCKENGAFRTENGGEDSGSEEIVEMDEDEFEKAVDMASEDCKFGVGDFVWGKIKTHSWWPGRIYDPEASSEIAAKLKQNNRFLVAFGDGTFAWCRPSQLKHFQEDFEEMSKQSNLKSFVSAVEDAVYEIGRLADMEMTCSCVPDEYCEELDRPLALNTGIREGVLVPEGGLGTISVYQFEPVELIAYLRYVAQIVTVTGTLELAVLKSQLSAFYRAKGGYKLPEYQDLQPIPGLEDNDTQGIGISQHEVVEVPNQGLFEEECISSLVRPGSDQYGQNVLRKCPGNSEDKLYQRRKQKSLAEIMGGGNYKEGNEQEEVMSEGGHTGKLSRIKKRKGMDEGNGHSADASESLSRIIERTEILESPIATEKKLSSGNAGGKEETKKRRNMKTEDSSLDNDGSVPTKGKGNRVKSVKNDDGDTEDEFEKVSESGESEKEDDVGDMRVQSDDNVVKYQWEKGSASRERKRSKYLSPPYVNTTLKRGQRIKEIEIEFKNVSSVVQMKTAANHLLDTRPISKFSEEETSQELSGELYVELDDGSSPQTRKQHVNLTMDQTKVEVPANEVLTEVRSAALDPVCTENNESLEAVGGLLSIFRSSIYRNGSNYKMFNKKRAGRKRKFQETGTGSIALTELDSAETKSMRRKVKKVGKMDKAKKVATAPNAKKNEDEDEGKDYSVALFVTFGQGSSLPTKNDLIEIYSNFGTLDETETDIFEDNFCARIVYLNDCDAEVAFNNSQESSPFGNDNVSFRLRYFSAAAKVRELDEIVHRNNGGEAPGTSSASQSPNWDVTLLNFIKQKLELMTSMLENSDENMSSQIKSKLEGEMKGLLRKVSDMIGRGHRCSVST